MYLSLILDAAQPHVIRELADAVSNPKHPDYGKYCDRSQLAKLVAIPQAEREELENWFKAYGMVPLAFPSLDEQQMLLRVTPKQLCSAFGESAVQKLLSRKSHRTFQARSILPRKLAGYVQSMQILPNREWSEAIPRQLSPITNDSSTSEIPLPADMFGATPADIRRVYQFPEQWNGSGETIAVMALGGYPNPDDLHRFWHIFNIQPPSVYSVQVGAMGARASHPLYQWETTMVVQWLGAIARCSRIVVYFIDPEYFADPWATFLLAILSDTHFQPTIACTTWSAPERQYYRVHGSEVIAGLLDRAAALGITFIAGSGDWGVFDGLPQRQFNGQRVCDAPWPHGIFPAVEERVLAVGGTQIDCWEPYKETAWSAPVSLGLEKALQIERMASSGGFSEHIPIPQWQQAVLEPYYPRSGDAPAVIPYGRGFPDVALMAWGADNNGNTAAYLSLIANQWRNDAGGTSLAAPVWAAIIACLNQARRSQDLPRVGFVNPLLYSLWQDQAIVFRPITTGNTDMILQAIASEGSVTPFKLPGFTARPGWNPLTGLGIPNVMNLIESNYIQ
ncbi:S53 family peptidase [Desmonostoc muscorum LEGE 12446]|uniref:Peptidase S53 domain-containing protein n=1 Tax=Desmonostoc muscorum LEGE 12446 TaxID=1828758 RepID=A0A8J7D8D4_DESMC|nr:S53 family peptidase [Desmonostoc muscorum]MCF2151390.1 S53 family peptidase [Desmonostoc muscorum LEGE 12446]